MPSSIEVLTLAKLAFYDNKPTATMWQTSTVSIPNNAAYAPVGFNANQEDNWGGHSTVTNNSRYTVQVSGTYRLSGCVQFASNATGVRAVEFMKNGVAYATNNQFVAGTSQFVSVPAISFNAPAVVGDYFEIAAFQNSGGALNTQINGTLFSVEFLHF